MVFELPCADIFPTPLRLVVGHFTVFGESYLDAFALRVLSGVAPLVYNSLSYPGPLRIWIESVTQAGHCLCLHLFVRCCAMQRKEIELERTMEKRWSIVWRLAITVVALIVIISVALQAKAGAINQSPPHKSTAPDSGPIVVHEEKHDLSPRLDSIPPVAPQSQNSEREQGQSQGLQDWRTRH